jgi:hypothetical protein
VELGDARSDAVGGAPGHDLVDEPVRCRLSDIMGTGAFHADVSKFPDTPVMAVLR